MSKVLSAVAISAMTIGAGANAATCADRDHVATQLEKRYNETLVANAVSTSNQILEIYGSQENDTWSIVIYLPARNLSCLAATGRGLDQMMAARQFKF